MKRVGTLILALVLFALLAYASIIARAEVADRAMIKPDISVADRSMALQHKEPVVVDRAMVLEKMDAYFDVPLDHRLQDYIFRVCESYNVDPSIVIAIIERESLFDTFAVGDDGDSFGLMQIQPRWHEERMNRLGYHDLYNPYHNVSIGIDYLAELIGKQKGILWALMAYNGGPTYANEKYDSEIVTEYARSIFERSKSL
jgi:soluble lytic murein transglycosylase-like protein